MSWLDKALKKIKQSFGSKKAGKSVAECPLKKTGLLVAVVQKHNRQTLSDAVVDIKGKSPLHKKSDKDGLALFMPLEPDTYKISVTLPQALKEDFEEVEVTEEVVALGSCPVHVIHVHPLPELKVKLVQRADRNKVIGGAKVELSGDKNYPVKTTLDSDGVADFGKVRAGKYTVKITLKKEDAENFSTPEPQEIELAAKQKLGLVVRVANNVVTPKVELEYKTVLLERNLAQYQDAKEEKIYADPTYIELSLQQSNKDYPFTKGAKLKCTGANVEAYLDEECKTKLAGNLSSGAALTNDQLKDGKKLKIYLRGKSAGQFDLSLEVDDPSDLAIKREDPAKEKMGVVELKGVLHQQDQTELAKIEIDPDTDPIATYHTNLKDEALPDQKTIGDEAKVKPGRLLHCQDGKNFGRAKLLLKKFEAGHWPDGCDDYEVVLAATNSSGSIELYDKEFDGTKQALPLKVKVSDLKAADKNLWVEGVSVTDKCHDVRLSIGIDRADGGLAKKPKQNGDWSRYTIVEIKQIKLEVKISAGKPEVWNTGKIPNRFYINTDTDGSGRKLKKKANLRDIKVVATLTKKIADVDIHFMLVADKDNAVKIKKSLKHTDKSDRKNLLHVSSKTNANGVAETDKLVLSQYGGDKFKFGAYIAEDPHLAKYIDGHADLKNKKPKLSAESVQVWRKLYYRVVCMDRADDTSYSNRLDEAGFKTRMDGAFLEMERTGNIGSADFQSVVKDKSIANYNTATFGADVKQTINIGLVEAQTGDATTDVDRAWDASDSYDATTKTTKETLENFTFEMEKTDDWLSSAHYSDKSANPLVWHALSDDKVTLVLNGLKHELKVNLTGIITAKLSANKIALKATLKKLDEWSGDSTGNTILIGMRWREIGYLGQVTQAALQTTLHESGHFLGLAPEKLPDATESVNPRQYLQSGSHCNYNINQCTMYHEFRMVFDFCDNCEGSLKARDLSDPAIASSDGY